MQQTGTSELNGPSAIFLRVAPGKVSQVLKELRARDDIDMAEATFGRYDIACIARFPSVESLRTTVTAIQRTNPDAVRSVHAYPAYSSWENATTEHSLNGWTFIRSSDPTKTNESIRKAGSVGVIIETTGQADSLARSGANDMEAFFKSVLKDIQNAPGVRYTETLLASKDL